MPYDKIDQLYDALKADGAVSKDREYFRGQMLAPGEQGYKNRKQLYDALKADGAVESPTYEDFAAGLGLHAVKSARRNVPQPQQPTNDDFQQTINDARQTIGQSQQAERRIGNRQQRVGLDFPQGDFGRVNLGQNRKVTKGQQRFNPETGKLEDTFVTPQGNEYENREMADIEQNQVDDAKRRELDPIGTQLSDAYAEQERLYQMANDRREQMENEGKDKGFFSRFLREAGRAAQSDKLPDNTSPSKDIENDSEYSAIMAAIRKNNELITTLEDQRDKQTNEFWHSFGTELANGYTFSLGGKAKMDDIIALTDAKKHIDIINKKRANGENLTHEEAVAEAVLKNNEWDREIQAKYGDEYGAWARAGKMGANSADFMVDFLMMGGAPASLARGVMTQVVKGGGKLLGNLATKGFGNFMLKTTGATLGSMVAGAEITNTIQLGKTASDVAQSMTGDVYLDPNGNYTFGHYEEDDNGNPKFVKGGNDFFTALAEAQRNGISENGSEILGTFLPGASKVFESIGLSKIARGLTALKGKNWYKNYSKFLQTAGFNGTVGEGLEEYGGMALDFMMGGDEWKKLGEGRTHVDIWLGVTTMSGMLNAPNLIGTGYSAVQYQRYKKAVNQADIAASSTMNPEEWSALRETIDGTDNANMPDVAMNILNDNNLTPESKRAAMDYIGNLQKMRGYSLGSIAADKTESEDEVSSNDSRAIDEGYTEGYDTQTPDDMKTFVDEAEAARENLSRYGDEFAKLVSESLDPVGTLNMLMNNDYQQDDGLYRLFSDDEIAAAADFYQKRARAQGVMDSAMDRIDLEVEKANAEVRSNTHQQTGNVITAQSGDNTYYIIGGDVATDEETGMPVVAGTGGAVVVKDALTGEVSVKSPQDVMVTSMQSADDLFRYNDEVLRQQLEQQADDDITYGSPANEVYDMEDQVTLQDGEGGTIDGTVVMLPNAVDGVFVVETNDGKALQMTADELNRRIIAHNGMEVQRGSVQEIPLENPQNHPEATPFTPQNTQNAGNYAQNQPQNIPEVSGNTPRVNENTPKETEITPEEKPQSALDRIPIRTDSKGQPVKGKNGRPILDWHKASVEDAAAALIETTGGDMVMARDTASDLVKNEQVRLEKVRKQKPKGDDPIEIAESRMAIRNQEQEVQATIKQWQDVNQFIQKQMRDEAAARQAEIEAAKSEEQRKREAEEARIRKEQQDEQDRQRLREQIEKDRAKRNREYEPLVKAREELAGDPDALEILKDTEPRDLEEWVSSLLRPHSMLWQDASDAEIGLQSELGLRRADMQRMMSLLGTKESGAKPFGKVVLDIYEGLSDAMKQQYTDEDVRQTLLNLFNEGSSTRMLNLTQEHRIEEARQMARENARRDAEAEMDAWADAYHLTPEERETFEDWLQLPPTEPEQEIINHIIIEDEYNRTSPTVGEQPVSGGNVSGIEGGEGQVQQTVEVTGNGNNEAGPAQGGEAQAGESPVSDHDVSESGSVIPQPKVDIPRFKAIRRKLADAYSAALDRGGADPQDLQDIAEAAKEVRRYVDEGLDDYRPYEDGIEDYDGDDPEKLADQYITRVYHDRYADDDADEQYIRTGLKPDMREKNEFVEYNGKKFEANDVGVCLNPNVLEKHDNKKNVNEGFEIRTALSDKGWVGAISVSGPTYGRGSGVSAGWYDKYFETEEECQAYWAQQAYDYLKRQNDKKMVKYMAALQLIIDKNKPKEQLSPRQGTNDSQGGNQKPAIAPSEQLKPTDLRDAVRPESAELGVNEANAKARALTNEEAEALMQRMEASATPDPQISLTPETWAQTFGLNNSLETPIGNVKMGEGQYQKFFDKSRSKEFGMAVETLRDPDIILIEPSQAKEGQTTERPYSYIFVKTFDRNGEKVKYYASVTVQRDNMEVSVSSHYMKPAKVFERLTTLERLYTKETLLPNSSEWHLAEQHNAVPDLLPTQENNVTSDGKGTNNSPNNQENLGKTSSPEEISAEEAKVDTNPTEAQKEAGNYQKGHINVDGYDITIENPKGSVRSGVDSKGNRWETTMRNTYGYIRGTEGVDGDHIDVFLSDNPTSGSVFVVDQVNPETGEFDEHKVMYGFSSEEEAREAYLSNYSEGWQGLGAITEVSREEFKKWVESSHRKTKPFHNYKRVNTAETEILAKGGSVLYSNYGGVVKVVGSNIDKNTGERYYTCISYENEEGLKGNNEVMGIKFRIDQKDMRNNLENGTYQKQRPQNQEPAKAKPEKQHKRLVSDDKMEELRKRLLDKMNNLNEGLDMERMLIGAAYAVGKIERGVTKFADFCADMIEDLGDAIRPYIKLFYNGARDLPEAAELRPLMDDAQTVDAFDVYNFDKKKQPTAIEKAEQVVQERKVRQQAKKIKAEQPDLFAGDLFGTQQEPLNEKQEPSSAQKEPLNQAESGTTLRPATEADIDGFNPTVYYEGKPAHIISIMRKGEQTSATTFRKPTISSILLTNGKWAKLEDLMVKDEGKNQKPVKSQLNKKSDWWSDPNRPESIDPKDYKTYMTDEAKNYFANFVSEDGKTDFTKWAHPNLAYITAAIWDEVEIPYEDLKDIPEIVEAENTIKKAEAKGKLEISDEEANRLAQRLVDMSQVRQDRKALVIIGLPAGGKSSVFANPLAKEYGARIIDSDDVKPWLDGFDGGNGAGYVHDASAEVAERAIDISVKNGDNIIIPRIGGQSVMDLSAALRLAGYDVQLYFNDVKGVTSIDRAASRFAETGRYLSLDYLTKKAGVPSDNFSKFAEKSIGGFLDERDQKQVQDIRGRLQRLRGELYGSGSGLWESLAAKREGAGETESTVPADLGGGEQQAGGNGVSLLLAEPLFNYAEWKSNDVKRGEKPKEIWNSKSGKPMPGKENKSNNNNDELHSVRSGQRVSAESSQVDEGAEQAGGAADQAGAERSPESDRAERSGRERTVEDSALASGAATSNGKDVQPQPKQKPKHNNRRNNVGERGKDYAPTSPKARFNANVEAIKLMRVLMDEGIDAPTKDQMEVLRRYSGWGGLGTFFNDATTAEYRTLRDLLTEEEYNDAVMSINSAYFTPATVIDTLWDIAEAMGFEGGNVLEGSAGIGNIIGQMPKKLSSRSDIEAVEIDKISGNILKLLYPDAKVHIAGFQDVKIPNGSVDLAITNVPFVTGLHVFDEVDKDLSRKFKNIHDFCIAKNIRKLREGGIGLFITSAGTLDKSTDLRSWITDEGQSDVVGAFRLNNETFGGTSVTSDIIVVRKRVNGVKSDSAIDVKQASPIRVGSYTDKYEKEHQTSMTVNDYFHDHPEMMAGEMFFGYEKGDTFRPGSYGLYPVEGKDQTKMMKDFVKAMAKAKETTPKPSATEQKPETNQLTAVKEGRMLVDDNGRLCISRMGTAVPLGLNDQKVKGFTKQQCFEDYQAVQKAVDDVLQQQLNDPDDTHLEPKLKALNAAYDKFVKRYGTLHKNTSIAFLRNDIDFPSFQALENYSETKDMSGKVKVTTKKTPVFTQRVLGFKTEPQPKTVKDAVIASIFRSNGIDLEWIANKLSEVAAPPNGDNWTVDDVRKGILVSRLGFEDPATGQIEIRYKYLSGNVREKLAMAEAYNTDGKYSANVEELRKVVPMDIPAHLIDFSLGSSWIPVELYKQYLEENYDLSNIRLNHVEGNWVLDEGYSYRNEKNRAAGIYSEKFRETIYGHQLVAAALNNRPYKVSKQVSEGWGSNKTTKTVVDKDATQACAVRVDEIKDEFKQWAKKKMQDDPELGARIEKIYNEKFNALVPMEIDDEFLPDHFEDSNTNITLRPHQKRGVIRDLSAPTMLAHEVGTGKSFTLITTAMEMRRLGTARKPMLVVQNATVAQMTSDVKLLYPNAKVLSLTEKDRDAEGRRAFYAKIRYNDWDLIIIPQSTFERIPDSPERELQFIQEKIDEKKHVIEAAMQSGMDSREIQRLKKELDKLEDEYGDKYLDSDPANASTPKKSKKKDAKKEAAALDKAKTKAQEQLDRAVDDVQYFDDLGVDALLIDEAHEYKHLGFQTSIGRGIKGIDPSYSKKCAGLYNKTRSVFEKAGWKNVVFATGTPISNTAAEIWTFMKYLMPADVMRANDIYYFDDFVHNFGAISQMLEFSTSGKFKENTRFAAYVNKPELIRIWSQVADTVLTKDAEGVKDKLPQKEGGKDQDVFLPQSPSLISIMAAVRAELERFENMTGQEKKENSSIPLTMYGIAKRAAIDPRLVNPDAPDEPMSKTNAAVKEIVKDLKETAKYKGTVAVFCDNQNRKGPDGSIEFNIYEDMKKKLIEAGVPESQIAIIKSGMSITAKQKVFDAVNDGSIRVVLGSTQTLGTGVNMQERLHLLIHMDAPDRPMDYTQRNGRIERQGNLHKDWNKPIRIVRFGVEDSLDVTAYQRLKTKSGFINSIMDGKAALANNQVDRTVEEEEEGLFDNPVAVLSGSQYALKKNQAERELRKYQGKRAQWEADQVYVTNQLRRNESEVEAAEANIKTEEEQLANIRKLFPNGKVKTITVEGTAIDMTKDDGEKKLNEAIKEKINDPVNAIVKRNRENAIYNDETLHFTIKLDGHDVNFTVQVMRESVYDQGRMRTVIHKYISYTSPDLRIESTAGSNSVRENLEEILDEVVTGQDYEDRIDAYKAKIDRINAETEQLKQRVGMEFQFDKELEQARKNVDEYTELMKKEMEEKEAKYAAQQKEAKENGGFDLSKAEDSEDDEDVRYSADEDWDGPIFYSNAMRAVESIRQEKATPEQWLAMIQKNGGLKVGEDKWLGLSDWLNSTDKRTITKDEILDYIRENQIEVEETPYYEGEEMDSILDGIYETEGLEFRDDFAEAFDIVMGEFAIKDDKAAVDLYNREHEDSPIEYDGYALDEDNENVIMNWASDIVDKAKNRKKRIDDTRLSYTTQGLDNKREIALTVPSIEPYKENDNVHFGDAGGGRAVAWIRFGETVSGSNSILEKANLERELSEKYNCPPYALRERASKEDIARLDAVQEKINEEFRNGSYGKRVLVIDEIQSKRHQDAREKGYKSDAMSKVQPKIDEMRKHYQELVAKRDELIDRETKLRDAIRMSPEAKALIGENGYVKKDKSAEYHSLFENNKELNDVYNERKDVVREILDLEQKMREMNGWSVGLVPDAPFEKNWHELAMKRMLRYAAENGYDKIAWTTGNQQEKRYDLGQSVEKIQSFEPDDYAKEYGEYRNIQIDFKNGDEPIFINVDKDGNIMSSDMEELRGKNLSEVLGKDLANKILSEDPGKEYSGEDLRIGGEGMRGFYDEMLPRFMNKYGKKWGVKVDQIVLPKLEKGANMMWSIDVTPEMKASVMQGQPLFRGTDEFVEGQQFPIRRVAADSSYNVLGRSYQYSSDLLPDEFATPQALLDAVRNAYPAYYAAIEAESIVLRSWDTVMAEARNARTVKDVKGTESYVERKTRQAIDAVTDMANRMHLDVEVLTTTEGLEGKKARSKGWFNPRTHKIVIVLPNHTNKTDVINTLLHEGVAHYGLRKMFGQNFDTFLDNVYNNVSPEIKARIDAAMKRNGWSRHEATEEYLARLAERTDFEHATKSGWWQKIKAFFYEMLSKAGFETLLTDNELRYILWRSYDHLLHPDGRRNVFDTAKDIQMQSRLKVGDYAEQAPVRRTATAEATPMAADELMLDRTDYASDEINDIVDKAKADGTYMKAPNGKPSKLNELQWAQVRTQAFKNWFGDWENDPENASKVVDKETGEPLVLYHGTNLTAQNHSVPFWEFYPNSHFGTIGQANSRLKVETWMPALATSLRKSVQRRRLVKTYEVFLNIRKPDRTQDVPKSWEDAHSEWWDLQVEQAKKNGYDGLVYLNRWEDRSNPADSWIVFEPNQVKSATDNSGDFSTEDNDIRYSLRTKEPPKKTGKGYKVFVLKDGQLYPPMVANPNGEGTPIGVWLDADAAPVAGTSKTGRPQVKAGGKGTQGGSGQLAYRPGWHLGTIPYALQFGRKDENGERTLFPNNFVWAEVEYADDVDYQDEARNEGMNANGKYQHSLAGLKHVPTDGSYKYRTNPDPKTDEWIITGAMRVNKILSREEVDELVKKAGREPQKIQDGDILTKDIVDELNAEIKATKEADEMGLLYRDDDSWTDDVAQEFYEKAVAQEGIKMKEAWQDSMVALKLIQNAIARETGKVATGAEDAYRFENRMHGRAKNMTEQYDWKYYRPMLKAFNDFCKANGLTHEQGMEYLISKSGLERNVYYAFRDGAKARLVDEVKKEREQLEKDYARGRISEADYRTKLADLNNKEQNGVDDFMKDVRESYAYQHAKEEYDAGNISYTEYLRIIETVIRGELKRKTPKEDAEGHIVSDNYYDDYAKDYSGLTETFAKDWYDIAQGIKKEAQRAIDPQERRGLWAEYDEAMRQAYETARQIAEDAVFSAEENSGPADILWIKINEATEETLKQSYEMGLMDRNTYNKVRAMFDYYIPLRGWEEDKASDVYTYMGRDNVFSPAVKKAWGRTSKAENPLAYIGNIAVSTILSGHRNQMKQHFLNYVMNNPTSLVSISESWYENIAPEGEAPVWILRTADTAGKSPDEIATIVNDFNDEMQQKQREGKAMPVKGRLRLDVHATNGQKAEHVVEVQRAGHTYQLYINGNPKAAQALNGSAARAVSRISDTWLGKKITKINRDMAMFFTSKNPAFVVSNLSRDLNMAGASVRVNENNAYNKKFIKNVAKVLAPRMGESSKWVPASKQPTGLMPSLMRKWQNGTLDLSNETERYFGEFMDEGGETGFVNMLSIDSFKEKMKKEIAEMNGSALFGKGVKETSVHKGLRLLGETFEFYNRCAEDATRFIVYMTSRQMGKTLEESIADAKDVTLNFNRKGTGGLGNAEVRDLFIFVNPAIQALANMYRMLKGRPLRFGAVTAAFIAGGAIIPWINNWLLNMFGDDDDKQAYWNLPPWVRKNNLVFWLPFTKNFLTIPLAQEFRVFYGVGEMMSSAIMDHPMDKWGLEVFSSVADLVPINPTGNGGNLMVDFAPTMVQPLMQVGENVDFTGKPIWRENQGNKYAPMYEKAYVTTPQWMIKMSEKVNDLTGGNEGKKGVVEKYMPFWGDYINNPAVWNHLLQGYFGGMYNTIAKTFDVGVTAAKGELPKIYQTPVVNRFLNRPVERDNAGALGEEYYNLTEERDAIQYELRTWQKKAADGEEGAQEHVDEILESPEYKRAEVVSHYEKIMKDLKAGEKAATESADKADIKEGIGMYKQQMMEELNAIENGKDPMDAAVEAYGNAKTFAEKNKLRMRIERLMMRQNGEKPKTKGRAAEVEKALSYVSDIEKESRDTNEQYLKLATAEAVRDDARIKAAKAKLKAVNDEYKKIQTERPDRAADYYRKHQKQLTAYRILDEQSRVMNRNKKLLGKGSDQNIMKLIANNRRMMLQAIESSN